VSSDRELGSGEDKNAVVFGHSQAAMSNSEFTKAAWPFRNLRAKSADLESVRFQWVAPSLFV
jgi:hypothetical protein